MRYTNAALVQIILELCTALQWSRMILHGSAAPSTLRVCVILPQSRGNQLTFGAIPDKVLFLRGAGEGCRAEEFKGRMSLIQIVLRKIVHRKQSPHRSGNGTTSDAESSESRVGPSKLIWISHLRV